MQSIPGTCSICSLQEFEVRDRGAEFLEAPFTAGNVGNEQVLMVTASRAPNIRRFHFLRLQRRAPEHRLPAVLDPIVHYLLRAGGFLLRSQSTRCANGPSQRADRLNVS